MSHQNILPLLMKSARLQQKIAAVHAQRDPNRLLILRLQTLRLMVQKRINALSASIVNAGQSRRPQMHRTHPRSLVLH